MIDKDEYNPKIVNTFNETNTVVVKMTLFSPLPYQPINHLVYLC